jgi:Family of unknown function (DUF6352)
MTRHFWGASGHLMLDRNADGRLLLTREFLQAYLARPELMPPEEACEAERLLHARLMEDPFRPVADADVTAILDADAQENWRLMVAFRDRLASKPTVEAAFIDIIAKGLNGLPPLFIDQLVQVIARAALVGCEDAFVARAAEMFYRPQHATVHDNTILLADAEIIETHEMNRNVSPLLSMLGGPAVSELEILKSAAADDYWMRSDANDYVLDFGGEPPGRAALAEALRRWITHLHGAEVMVTPAENIKDKDWRWFVGLDAESTHIGNRLWRGQAVTPDEQARVIALFKLEFADESRLVAQAKGHPVYLILACQDDRLVRMKPQNLVTGLPLVTLV